MLHLAKKLGYVLGTEKGTFSLPYITNTCIRVFPLQNIAEGQVWVNGQLVQAH